MNCLLSIVVPAYNASKYIDSFFSCVEAQMTRDFEIIIVDDGSNDDTYQRLLNYQLFAKDYKLVVIHQENMGQNGARLRGLKEASGKYIWFVDIDDLFVSDAIAQIEGMLQWGAFPDCVLFSMERLQKDGKTIYEKKLFPNRKLFCEDEKKQVLSLAMGTSKLNSLWSKVFSRSELLNSIEDIAKMPALRYGEDFVISSLFLENAATVLYDPSPIYIYRDISSSVMHDEVSEKMLDDSNEVFRIKNGIASRLKIDFSRELLAFSGSEVCGFARRILYSKSSFLRKKELFGLLFSTDFFSYAKNNRYKGDTLKRRLTFSLARVCSAVLCK